MSRPPGPLPHGTCSGCGVWRSLRTDGTLFSHHVSLGFDPTVGYTRHRYCEGSRRPPSTRKGRAKPMYGDVVQEKPLIEVSQLNDDSAPDLFVVRMEEPNDERWWRIVEQWATDYEYQFGICETEEDVTVGDKADGEPNGSEYDPAKVAAWVRRHVEQPTWRWHWWQPATEDEADADLTHWLASSTGDRPNESWWRGAVITVRSEAATDAIR